MSFNDDHSSNQPWRTGDPISKEDSDNVRDLIYAGFSRRRVAAMLGLHKDLVGSVFDDYAPKKYPKMADETRKRILEMINAGASLSEMAADRGVSEASVRMYAHSLGVHPRTLTAKYLREHRLRGNGPSTGLE